MENHPSNNTNCCQRNPNQPRRIGSVNTNWHWLI